MSEGKNAIRATGGCLCGAVRYEVRGKLGPVYACHCGQCRRSTGHVYMSSSAKRENFRLIGEENLRWYQSSARARRGFCTTCGSVLFWDAPEENYICFTTGSIDPPTGLTLGAHIFVADKGDHYAIADGLPQFAKGSGG